LDGANDSSDPISHDVWDIADCVAVW
jgi:hypothetical protein